MTLAGKRHENRRETAGIKPLLFADASAALGKSAFQVNV